jgi:hypothetical protein
MLQPKRAESILGESQKYVDLMYFGDQKSALKKTQRCLETVV